MTKIKCCEKTCHEDATAIVKIQAFTAPGTQPIEMVLGLEICAAHVPGVEILDPEIWDLLDTWAIQGRKALIDRSLTLVFAIPLDGEEGLLMASYLANRRAKHG